MKMMQLASWQSAVTKIDPTITTLSDTTNDPNSCLDDT